MTTPRRPTDEEFETLAAAHDGTQGCQDMEAEARRARSGEEQAGRDRDDLARANASLARERDLAIEAHYNATAKRDAIRQRVIDLFDGGFTTRRPEAQAAADALRELVGLSDAGPVAGMARHAEVRARERAESERDEARAWAAKVEAAFGDAQRELSTILARGPDEKLDDAARRVVAECDALRAEVERLKAELHAARMAEERQSAARAVAEREREDLPRIKAILVETRTQRDGALEHVAKLEAQIDRMRQRIQELEEHHG